MKAKALFITTLLLLQGQVLFSQCISIELSVTWAMGYDIFNKDSTISIPTLNITYRNNCDTSYYFFKVSPRSDSSAMLSCWGSIHYDGDNDYLKSARFCSEYTDQKFNVIMGWEDSYDTGWLVFSDTVDYPEQFSMENIHCSLQLIYDYIYFGKYRACKSPAYFVPSDITTGNIISNDFVKNQFVFLKPNETHIDTYNLVVYKTLGACFTFLIEKDIVEKYVMIEYGKDKQKMELPTIVGEYQLYSGAFNTNKVTVCFGDK